MLFRSHFIIWHIFFSNLLCENFSNQKKQDSELEFITSLYQEKKKKNWGGRGHLEQMSDIYQVPEGKTNIKATKICVISDNYLVYVKLKVIKGHLV